MGIRETRLENDFNEVSQLIANSGGTIALISSQGKPAYEYVIEYRCKGIERLQGNDPVFRTNHRVKITLSNDCLYKPTCLSRFLLDNGRKSF